MGWLEWWWWYWVCWWSGGGEDVLVGYDGGVMGLMEWRLCVGEGVV